MLYRPVDALLLWIQRSAYVPELSIVCLKVHRDINLSVKIEKPIVTTGTFDGIHVGHRKILQRVKELAKEEGGESVLFSFYPHPRMVLYPQDHGLSLLQTREEKVAALEEVGMDHFIEIPFTKEFSKLSAVDYVERVLVNGIGVQTTVIGYDHRFGKNREGDINTLRELGKIHGFRVEEIPAHVIKAVNVSSTKVRNALGKGDVLTAKALLGRCYRLTGKVIEGDRIGRTIGFPTANIKVEDDNKLIPADGVYSVDVLVEGSRFSGMMNIGFRPTVHEALITRTLEVHILDLERDLYGMELTIEFKDQIRKEMRFSSLEELKAQLLRDKQAVIDSIVE